MTDIYDDTEEAGLYNNILFRLSTTRVVSVAQAECFNGRAEVAARVEDLGE